MSRSIATGNRFWTIRFKMKLLTSEGISLNGFSDKITYFPAILTKSFKISMQAY
jgi:hypothetical protein